MPKLMYNAVLTLTKALVATAWTHWGRCLPAPSTKLGILASADDYVIIIIGHIRHYWIGIIVQGQTMIPSSRNNLNTGNPFVCIPKQLPELDSDNNFLPQPNSLTKIRLYPENKIWIWIIPHHHKHSNNLFYFSGEYSNSTWEAKVNMFQVLYNMSNSDNWLDKTIY